MNSVALSGFVRKDARETQCINGSTRVSFLLSVSRNYRNPDSGYYESDLFRCVRFCNNDTALNYMRNHVKPNARVIVQGELRSYQQGEQWHQEVLVHSVEILKKSPNDLSGTLNVDASDFDDGVPPSPSPYASGNAAPYSNPWADESDDDGDLPF